MGKNEGVIRLRNGFCRTLTKSELARKYIYITNDKSAGEVLNKNFELFINDKKFGVKNLDKLGRILGLSWLIDDIGKKEITVKALRGNLFINF